MTPDQISALTAIAAILQQVGTWPIGTLVMAIILGPWISHVWITWAQEKRIERERAEAEKIRIDNEKRQERVREEHEKQFLAVKQMYENNVDLVRLAEKNNQSLLDCVLMNTNKWTEVSEKIDMNQFCPLARIRKTKQEDMLL